MKKTAIFSVFCLIILIPACSMYWPGTLDLEYSVYSIIFRIQPDDAHILLNGRFIGEVYEFSSVRSALKLTSKNHRIVIKKKGYIEEEIDLSQYSSRDIIVKLTMKPDPSPVNETPEEKPEIKFKKPEYIPKSEPVKEPVMETKPEETSDLQISQIVLEIQPEDAAIYLDGKFWGIAPGSGKIENLKLKTGTYILEVIKPGFQNFRKTIQVKGQKLIRITVILKKDQAGEAVVI
jgi:hypothetical protein